MIRNTLFVTLLAIGAVLFMMAPHDATSQPDFEEWKAQWGIEIPSGEEPYRLRIFMENVAKINQHNQDPSQTYKMGINMFTHLSQKEFEAMYLDPVQIPDEIKIEAKPESQKKISFGDVDWVSRGAVTPVKTEAQCTASYAFAGVAAIESLYWIKNHYLQEFSNQQIIDCSRSFNNYGCGGGRVENTYNYAASHSLILRVSYPYHASEGQCQDYQQGVFKIDGFRTINYGDCYSLENQLQIQPVSVYVDAQNFNNYHSGIFSNCGNAANMNLLLVGSTDRYWKLKNCWGPNWGEGGYIRLSKGNICGICSMPSYPINGWGVAQE